MKSVGEILRKQRENKKFTLEDVHEFIKIHPKFLRALEKDDYSVFSDKVHAKGFLKVYVDFLGLKVDEVLALWRREYGGEFEKKQKKDNDFSLKKVSSPKILITPGLVLIITIVLLIFGFFGFLFYQYRSYSGAPNLVISNPENNLIVNRGTVDVTGETDKDSVVLINNQRIVINSNGSFATSIKLHEGINTFSFLAVNKLGKETEEIRTVIYRKKEEETMGGSEKGNKDGSENGGTSVGTDVDTDVGAGAGTDASTYVGTDGDVDIGGGSDSKGNGSEGSGVEGTDSGFGE